MTLSRFLNQTAETCRATHLKSDARVRRTTIFQNPLSSSSPSPLCEPSKVGHRYQRHVTKTFPPFSLLFLYCSTVIYIYGRQMYSYWKKLLGKFNARRPASFCGGRLEPRRRTQTQARSGGQKSAVEGRRGKDWFLPFFSWDIQHKRTLILFL